MALTKTKPWRNASSTAWEETFAMMLEGYEKEWLHERKVPIDQEGSAERRRPNRRD